MKKAFTLVELIGAIVILGIIAIIAIPFVEGTLKENKEKAYLTQIESIKESTKNWAAKNTKLLPELGESYTITLNHLQTGGYIGKIIDPRTGEPFARNVKIIIQNTNNGYVYMVDTNVNYADNSGANEPELFTNMIPVVYDDESEKWQYADIKEKWYDYDSKEWANAVILKKTPSKSYTVNDDIEMSDIAQMYVWIPRYKYTIFNGNNGSVNEQLINVTFEPGTSTTGTVRCHDAINQTDSSGNAISEICKDSTQAGNAIVNGASTYTHPAFCFGRKNTNGSCDGTELEGIWIGKFEVSGTATAANLTVLPNVSPLVNQTVSTYFNAMSGVASSFNIKDETNTLADSHMMKNMEWGAVAYLKQSEYGLGTTDIALNNYYDSSKTVYYMTGCGSAVGTTWSTTTTCTPYNEANGQAASTTGNVYGVYDMSGGAWEYVMGNMVNTSGEFYPRSAGTFSPADKYYDAYTYNTSNTTHGRGKLGDATKETGSTSGGWYSDYAYFPSSSGSWFARGGSSDYGSLAGVFDFARDDGGGYDSDSARLVVSRAG